MKLSFMMLIAGLPFNPAYGGMSTYLDGQA
jgi:hypothetical protein